MPIMTILIVIRTSTVTSAVMVTAIPISAKGVYRGDGFEEVAGEAENSRRAQLRGLAAAGRGGG